MIKIIVVIIVAMISSFSYYGAVNEKGEKVVDLTTNIQEENVVENESVEETQGNIIEQIGNTIAQVEIIQNGEIITENAVNEITTPVAEKTNTSKNNNKNKTQESQTTTQTKVIEEQKNIEIEETATNNSTNQKSNINNVPKCSHSNSNWYNSKAEAVAVYNAEIKKWDDKWTNYEIDNDTYYKNCPSGYEVFSCPYCNKWTINLYY